MDLIDELMTRLQIDPLPAQALAGRVLEASRLQVASDLGPETAEQMRSGIPELLGWSAEAAEMLGESPRTMAKEDHGLLGGGLAGGGLFHAAAGAMGMFESHLGALQHVLPLLDRLGLDASALHVALPLIAQFLRSRLSPELAGKVLSAVPVLSGGSTLETVLAEMRAEQDSE